MRLKSKFKHLSHLDILAFCIIGFWLLFFSHVAQGFLFFEDGEIKTSIRTIYGDWAAHAIYTQVFASSPPSTWFKTHPMLAGVPFNYPFMSSLLAGMAMHLGLEVYEALAMMSWLALLGVTWASWGFFRGLPMARLQASIATTLLFLGGGMGWVIYVRDLLKASGAAKLWDMLLYPPLDYAELQDQTLKIGDSLMCLFFPQRALQLGMLITFLILTMLWRQVRLLNTVAPRRSTWLALGVAVGLMPTVHMHSAIVIAIVSVSIASWYWLFGSALDKSRAFAAFASYFTAASVVGVVALLLTLRPFAPLPADVTRPDTPFMNWQWGWLVERPVSLSSWVEFWLIHWGLFMPLVALSMSAKRWRRDPFVWAGLFIFALANSVRLQPWDWDNTKILIYAYALLIPATVDQLSKFFKAKPIPLRLVACLVFFSLVATGSLSVSRFIQWRRTVHGLWNTAHLSDGAALRAVLPPASVVLSSQRHNDWTGSFAGARSYLSYTGWMWSYGFDSRKRQQAIRQIYQGGPAADVALAATPIQYVVIDDAVREDLQPNDSYFAAKFPVVLKTPTATVYQVK